MVAAKTASKGRAAAKAAAKTAEPKVPGKLERHPLSEKYGPPVTQDELLGLGTDMKDHGQHDDIIMFEGKILAGWNRYMACLQMGLKPKTKEMNKGSDPVSVAFGTNFVRRRLNSVQKAFYGAQFSIDTNAKQTDVAKIVSCNLNRLNQCSQLLKRDDEDAKEAVEKLRTNPEISGAVFEEMLAELGIARQANPPAQSTSGPARSNTFVDDDIDDILGGDDDLTGGAIDSLLDEIDPPDEGVAPTSRKPASDGVPSTGSKPTSNTRATETVPSRMAKAFRKLPSEDQVKFVNFAGIKLAAAVNAAIGAGKFTLNIAKAPESTKVNPSIIVPMPLKKGNKAAAPKGKAAKKTATRTRK